MSWVTSEPRVGHALEKRRITANEFLAWDAGQTVKHEFVRGEVFAMAGGEDRNNIVALNLALALKPHLKGTPCQVFVADVKLRVEAADGLFYPDLMVTCSAADAADRLIKREPVLVVEVLSPSTSAFDRGEKFAAYRQLPSLAEFLLVDIDARRCELYRKGTDGLWVLHPTQGEEPLHLASVGLTIGAQDLWADLEPDLPAPATAAR
jgi:Uma2 family endonuclease